CKPAARGTPASSNEREAVSPGPLECRLSLSEQERSRERRSQPRHLRHPPPAEVVIHGTLHQLPPPEHPARDVRSFLDSPLFYPCRHPAERFLSRCPRKATIERPCSHCHSRDTPLNLSGWGRQ